MADTFGWIGEVEELSAAYMSVDIQTTPDLNVDDALMWPTLMPRLNVKSVKIGEMGSVSFRPVSGRRTWNQRGRQIPLVLPKLRTMEIEPVEGYFTIDEKEMQHLRERFNGARDLIRTQIKADVRPRYLDVASANLRRIEMDAFEAWIEGLVTVRDPQNNQTYTVGYEFDTARYEEAGVAWNGVGVNAYDEFVAWFIGAQQKCGALAGAALCQPVLTEVLKDAPAMNGGARMSLANLAQRIQDDTGSPFRFYRMDVLPNFDDFTGTGIKTQAVPRWPNKAKIAAVPADQKVGTMAFAPVGRAMDVGIEVPASKIDINGMSVFPETRDNGRSLTVEVQGNIFPNPNEKRVAVMDTKIPV